MPPDGIPHIGIVVSVAFDENAYVVSAAPTGPAVVIDPGLEPDKILRYLDTRSLRVEAVLNTHGHADHIAGNGVLKDRYPQADLCIHEADAPLLADPVLNLSQPFGFALTSPPADRLLHDRDTVVTAGLRLEVVHIPGHSPGHVVFVWPGTPSLVFGGDVLFAGSIGRTDFPGGDQAQLIAGIRQKLYTMPADTRICPGHGPSTTVGQECRTNPFVSGAE